MAFGYELTVFVEAPGEPTTEQVEEITASVASAVDKLSPNSVVGPVVFRFPAVLFSGVKAETILRTVV